MVFREGQESMLREPELRDMLVRLATQRQYLVAQIERRIRSMEQMRSQIETLVPGVQERPPYGDQPQYIFDRKNDRDHPLRGVEQ